jgi:hypothetical protein
LKNCRKVLIIYLQPSLPLFLSVPVTPPPSPAVSRAPAALAPRALQLPRPPLTTSRWPSPRPSTSRHCRPSRHACCRACQQLLHVRSASRSLKACPGVPLDFFYPFHHAALLLLPPSARLPSLELRRSSCPPSSAASAASHLQFNAPVAPPQPTKA